MRWLESILPCVLFLQAALIGVDEFHFHRRRGLGIWERLGHPLDSFSVLLCYLYLWRQPLHSSSLEVYLALATFSCLLITKDEFIHNQVCPPGESWLHALLFILHPLAFAAAALLRGDGTMPILLRAQTLLVAFFLLYQILYWSFRGKRDIAPPFENQQRRLRHLRRSLVHRR